MTATITPACVVCDGPRDDLHHVCVRCMHTYCADGGHLSARSLDHARKVERAQMPTAWQRVLSDDDDGPRRGALPCHCLPSVAYASGRRVPTIELARRIESLTGIPIAAWVEVARRGRR